MRLGSSAGVRPMSIVLRIDPRRSVALAVRPNTGLAAAIDSPSYAFRGGCS
jgi:hypothetical protein